MSVQALTWAYSNKIPPEMNPTDRFVLVTLANFADAEGRCWPSLSTLARMTNLHRGTVVRSIARLEDLYGAITKLRSGGGPRGRSNVYKLSLEPLQLTRELGELERTRSWDEPSHDELLTLLDADDRSRSATPVRCVDNPVQGSRSATTDGSPSATPATGGVAENDQSWSRSARRTVSEPSLNDTRVICTGGHHDDWGDPVSCGVDVDGCTAFAIDEDTRSTGLAHVAELREQLERRRTDDTAPKELVR